MLSKSVQQVQNLILSFHPVIVMETVEEERVQTLLQTATQEMQMPLFEWSITQGLVRSPASYQSRWTNEYAPPGSVKPTAFEDTADPLKALQYIQAMTQKAVFLLKDFAKHLDDPVLVRQFREVSQDFSHHRSTLVVSGETVNLPPELAHDAVMVDIKLPGRDELHAVVMEVIQTLRHRGRIQVELQESEIPILVQALNGMTLKQARQVTAYAALEDGKLSIHDVARILHRKAQVIREGSVLEYFPVEENTVSWGGFGGLKQWLNQARVGFSPQAHALNLAPPKGILIVGIQGCGKSLAAKAIAQAWKMPLLKLDAGRLYDKYVGESEKNFRQAITLAESMAPAVLWIDEIEKSLGNSASGDGDGGLSRRMFGSFLTWMQEKSQEVFVVA
ncbi:MAG: AAA family ATPase, partial [Cyanobacteria bacterium]|nr:AAA family ATPase [Cyanobacteriota bacterium]MDW8201920.1 AAA family ATPase [Cyanobacteriota bacterium SKYGB_h_bin112]